MKKGRMIVVAIAIAVVGGSTMAACQRAEDAATRQDTTQERKTGRGATAAATTSSSDSPEAVTALMAWGNNYFGQLGDGTYGDNRATPVKVGGLRGAEVEALAGGQGHTLALRGDGAVLAWGYNRDGELGNGTNEDSPTPVVVKDSHDPTGHLGGVRAIAAGSSHGLALKEDGSVWAWGANDQGQLGNGTETLGSDALGTNAPAEVKDLVGVKLIAAGLDYSLAGR
jgi:alpha-tubulin suppressor-like RCC1 family protein